MQIIKKAFAYCLNRHFREIKKFMGHSAARLIGLSLLCASGLGIGPMAGATSVTGIDGRPVNAAVDFTIIIPVVLRMMENKHPSSLQLPDASTPHIAAQQRIVVLSTLRRGFCMDLRLNQTQIADWQLKVSGSKGGWVEAVVGGYRLCIARAGRYELALQHEFGLKQATLQEAANPSDQLAMNWPVNVSMVSP